MAGKAKNQNSCELCLSSGILTLRASRLDSISLETLRSAPRWYDVFSNTSAIFCVFTSPSNSAQTLVRGSDSHCCQFPAAVLPCRLQRYSSQAECEAYSVKRLHGQVPSAFYRNR